jgi:Tol biopolymer transport system component
MDFGLARRDGLTLTSVEGAAGTPGYMAPEQISGAPVDRRTDVWAFGAVLHEMLTGQRFTGQTPTLPEDLGRIVRKALSDEPGKRYQRVDDLAVDLRAASSAIAQPQRLRPSLPGLVRGRRGLATAVILGALVLAAVVYFRAHTASTSPPASPASLVENVEIIQLTTTGVATAPAISPDGKYVVFAQNEGGERSLWMRQVGVASQVRITPPGRGSLIAGATFAPDGSFVDFALSALTATQREVWRVPFLGGTPKRLLGSYASAVGWSLDGRHIAFVRRNGASSRLVIADPDGSHERQVAERKLPSAYSGFSRPAWTADGAAVILLATGGGATDPRQELVAVGVAGGAERVMPVPIAFTGAGPDWLDRTSLVVSGSLEEGAPSQLWRVSYPDGRLSRLTNDLSNYRGVSVAAGSGTLVTGRTEYQPEVWFGDASGKATGEVVRLASAPALTELAWAGERLLYTSLSEGHPSVAAITPGRSAHETVAQGNSPAATSDGHLIFFVSAGTGDTAGLWRVDADGTHPTRLVAGEVFTPVVTRDDRKIIFSSPRNGLQTLWSVPIEGGTPTQLTSVYASRPRVSPDGKSILFGASGTGGELGICDLPSCAEVRRVTIQRAWPNAGFTSDGKGIVYFEAGQGTNLMVQPLDGSPRRQLTHFSDDRYLVTFAWSHNGKWLAVARTSIVDDIVLFKGLRR